MSLFVAPFPGRGWVRCPPEANSLGLCPHLKTIELSSTIMGQMCVVRTHDPRMSKDNHSFIHIDPFGLLFVSDENRCYRPPIVVVPVFLKMDRFSADHLYETGFCRIAPRLSVFRAIDCVQSDPDPAPLLFYINRISVYDPQYFGY